MDEEEDKNDGFFVEIKFKIISISRTGVMEVQFNQPLAQQNFINYYKPEGGSEYRANNDDFPVKLDLNKINIRRKIVNPIFTMNSDVLAD